MKTIGLLGGTSWSSTIEYYKLLNKLVNEHMGGHHSAKILLKSIDYHDIMTHYGKSHDIVAQLLKQEFSALAALKPDCILICCNSLHKYYDIIKSELGDTPPVFHAVELVAEYLKSKQQKKVLLLATQFTMEDGFFAAILEKNGIQVTIPEINDRQKIENILESAMQNQVTTEARNYFAALTRQYADCESVVLGCTECPLVLDEKNSCLPIINPIVLQATHAVAYAMDKHAVNFD